MSIQLEVNDLPSLFRLYGKESLPLEGDGQEIHRILNQSQTLEINPKATFQKLTLNNPSLYGKGKKVERKTVAPLQVPKIVPKVITKPNTMQETDTVLVAPVVSPRPTPSIVPTVSPRPTPSIVPTVSPKIVPTVSPKIVPTVSPKIVPTVSPRPTPSIVPTVSPRPTPSIVPTVSPRPTPSIVPTVSPRPTPSIVPTVSPKIVPTVVSPKIVPTVSPKIVPSIVEAPIVPPQVVRAIPSTVKAIPSSWKEDKETVKPTVLIVSRDEKVEDLQNKRRSPFESKAQILVKPVEKPIKQPVFTTLIPPITTPKKVEINTNLQSAPRSTNLSSSDEEQKAILAEIDPSKLTAKRVGAENPGYGHEELKNFARKLGIRSAGKKIDIINAINELRQMHGFL